MDDGSSGEDADTVLTDFKKIVEKLSEIGLTLNFFKFEIIVLGIENRQEIYKSFNEFAPGINLKEIEINPLGAPLRISGSDTISKIINQKLRVSRMKNNEFSPSFFILRNSLSEYRTRFN